MTKTLTEQWRDGTLNGGIYYLLLRDGTTVTDKTVYIVGEKQLRWHYSSFDFVKEVLEPVPSYEEYKDIIQQNVNQEAAIETYIEDIKRLQEQINEANEIIKECCKRIEFRQVCLASFPPQFKIYDCLYNEIEDYFKKYDINWGVK